MSGVPLQAATGDLGKRPSKQLWYKSYQLLWISTGMYTECVEHASRRYECVQDATTCVHDATEQMKSSLDCRPGIRARKKSILSRRE